MRRNRGRVGAVCAALVVAATGVLAAPDLEQYREFRLGSPASTVIKLADMASPRDLTTVHERPALLQELHWRPPYRSDGAATGADPVRRIVFSFVDDRLFRIAVEYDRSRTEGLTRNDMIDALAATYGERVPLPARSARDREALDAGTPIAHWRSANAVVMLLHYEYAGTYSLLVTSPDLERDARRAQAAAVTLEAREAPAREAARLKKQADASREAAEKARSANKDTFRP